MTINARTVNRLLSSAPGAQAPLKAGSRSAAMCCGSDSAWSSFFSRVHTLSGRLNTDHCLMSRLGWEALGRLLWDICQQMQTFWRPPLRAFELATPKLFTKDESAPLQFWSFWKLYQIYISCFLWFLLTPVLPVAAFLNWKRLDTLTLGVTTCRRSLRNSVKLVAWASLLPNLQTMVATNSSH